MVSAFLLTSQNWAAPSPIEDEAFLMFLADTLEEESGLVDPLTMTDKEKALTIKLETETTDVIENTATQEDKNVN